MPILADYSQIAISCATVFPEDMKKGKDTKKMQDIIRHVTLKSLVTYNRDRKKTYGEMVICCDSSPSWRKLAFPYYKAHRAKNKEESDLDWDSIRQFIDELEEDLIEVFPYPVIKVPGAEGDDCIGVIANYLQEAPSQDEDVSPLNALSGEAPNVLVLSSDHDFKQLLKHRSVKQWSPMQKQWVTNTNPQFILDKIIEGDKGDGIPSVLMEDDFLVNGTKRATSVTVAVREKFKNLSLLNEEELKRFKRNQMLIDFDYIPTTLQESIVESYNQPRKKRNRQNIFNYLVKHNCRELIDRIEDF